MIDSQEGRGAYSLALERMNTVPRIMQETLPRGNAAITERARAYVHGAGKNGDRDIYMSQSDPGRASHRTGNMFSRFFASRYSKVQPAEARGPAGSDIYAIGDIHGRVDLLRKLQSAILSDADRRNATRKLVVYLGDYIDRGPESRSVIALLIEQPLPGFESVFLKGNHEDSLLEFLDDPHAAAAWLSFGGDATLYSYGVSPPNMSDPDEIAAAQKALSERLPPDHLAFLKSMKLLHIEGDYAFVHAGVRQNVPLDRQAPEDLMWIRDEFLESQADFGKRIVHGHSIEARPVVRRNRIGIDTGAFATGTLTCLVISNEETRFLKT